MIITLYINSTFLLDLYSLVIICFLKIKITRLFSDHGRSERHAVHNVFGGGFAVATPLVDTRPLLSMDTVGNELTVVTR